jgi:hypothetical protein
VPQGKSARIYVSGQGDSAQLTTTNSIGQQNIFLESTPNRDFEINSLQDVFDKVSAGTVCVLDETGDYFWNTKKVLETIETQINAREDTCIKP